MKTRPTAWINLKAMKLTKVQSAPDYHHFLKSNSTLIDAAVFLRLINASTNNYVGWVTFWNTERIWITDEPEIQIMGTSPVFK